MQKDDYSRDSTQNQKADFNLKLKNIQTMQVCAQVRGSLDDAICAAQQALVKWLGDQLPNGTKLDSTQKIETARVTAEILRIPEDEVWAARIEVRSEAASHSVLHEIEFIPQPATPLFIYRQSVLRFSGADHKAPREVPPFLEELGQLDTLYDAGRPINGKAWVVQDLEELDEFLSFLKDEERNLPVYMVTETNRGSHGFNTLVNFEYLAKHCIGTSHVVLMTYDMGYEWTEKVGKWLSAYLGTVRTYKAKTPLNEASKQKHPLAMPERIINWEHDGSKGPEAFTKFLVLQAMQASATQTDSKSTFIPFSTIKSMALDGQFQFSEGEHWKVKESKYKKRIDILETRISEITQDSIAMQTENNRLRSENALLVSRLYQFEKSKKSTPAENHNDGQRSVSRDGSGILVIDAQQEKVLKTSALNSEIAALLKGAIKNAFSQGEDILSSKQVKAAAASISATISATPEDLLDEPFYNPASDEEFITRYRLSSKELKGADLFFDYDKNSQKILVALVDSPR